MLPAQRYLPPRVLFKNISWAAKFAKYKPKKEIQWFSLIIKSTFAVLGIVLPRYIFPDEDFNEVQDYDYDKPKVKKMLMSIEESMELKLDAALKNIRSDYKSRKRYADDREEGAASSADLDELKDEMLERVHALKASLFKMVEEGSTVMEEQRLKISQLEEKNRECEKLINEQKKRQDIFEERLKKLSQMAAKQKSK